MHYREIHTCPRCGGHHEIPAPALLAQSVYCPECAVVVEAEQREYEGLSMTGAMAKAGIDGILR